MILILTLQCLLFYRPGDEKKSGTLSGNKKKVYVMLKVLKKCTDANITSFKASILTWLHFFISNSSR